MRKLAFFAAAALLAASLAGCSSGNTQETTAAATTASTTAAAEASSEEETAAGETEAASAGDTVYQIGICQLVQHPALDAATEGFQAALKEKLGDNVEFDLQNAASDRPSRPMRRPLISATGAVPQAPTSPERLIWRLLTSRPRS